MNENFVAFEKKNENMKRTLDTRKMYSMIYILLGLGIWYAIFSEIHYTIYIQTSYEETIYVITK